MNYFTAIIAVPLFLAIFLFECWLVYKHRDQIGAINNGKWMVATCMIVSFLQMVSCWFWFFGFVFSKLDSVFSEGMGDDETMNCPGLVGAEVILAIFQCIFTLQTMWSCFMMYSVYHNSIVNKSAQIKKMTPTQKGLAGGIIFILVTYTAFAFITAQNRRCKQGNHYLMAFQHHFYPIYLGVDVVSSTLTQYYAKLILKSTEGFLAQASVLSGSNESMVAMKSTTGALGTRNSLNMTTMNQSASEKSTNRRMQALADFYAKQTLLSIIGGFFAVGIFIIQFVAKIEALALIACIFCVCMYVIYACRRIPILVMYTKWDWTNLLTCFKSKDLQTTEGAENKSLKSSSLENKSSILPKNISSIGTTGGKVQPAPLPMTRVSSTTGTPRGRTPAPMPMLSKSPSQPISEIGETSKTANTSTTATTMMMSPSQTAIAVPAAIDLNAIGTSSPTITTFAHSYPSPRSPASPSGGAPSSSKKLRIHLSSSAEMSSSPDLAALISKLKTASSFVEPEAAGPTYAQMPIMELPDRLEGVESDEVLIQVQERDDEEPKRNEPNRNNMS